MRSRVPVAPDPHAKTCRSYRIRYVGFATAKVRKITEVTKLFCVFFSIKTPFRRSKPDSLQLLHGHFCRFEPVFCPSEPFSPLFVCFSKTPLRFANLKAKLFLLENTQILSHFFASKNGILSVLFTFYTPPSYCIGGTMLLYWEYNVIVLGLQ